MDANQELRQSIESALGTDRGLEFSSVLTVLHEAVEVECYIAAERIWRTLPTTLRSLIPNPGLVPHDSVRRM